MKKTLLYLFVFVSTIANSVGQSNFYDILADSTLTLTKQIVRYDPSYFQLDYPNGDVPKGKGVCTDVVIRAYRKIGIDLQKEVHEDMTSNFSKYPKYWGLSGLDKNIDHRRVPNLMTFFYQTWDYKTNYNQRQGLFARRYYMLESSWFSDSYWNSSEKEICRWTKAFNRS